jgi:hypothetical protein
MIGERKATNRHARIHQTSDSTDDMSRYKSPSLELIPLSSTYAADSGNPYAFRELSGVIRKF